MKECLVTLTKLMKNLPEAQKTISKHKLLVFVPILLQHKRVMFVTKLVQPNFMLLDRKSRKFQRKSRKFDLFSIKYKKHQKNNVKSAQEQIWNIHIKDQRNI